MPDLILYKHRLLTVPALNVTERLDVYISRHSANLSRSKVQQLCREKKILINDKPAKSSYQLKSGEEIYILSPFQTFGQKIVPNNRALEIVFEDEEVLVVNKESGISVHPGLGDHGNTLLDALLHHLNGKLPYVVHRIDKGTSGLVILAKTDHSNQNLQQQFISHTIQRKYTGLAWGYNPEKGKIENYIGRNPANPYSIEISSDQSFGKHAITHFNTIKHLREASQIEFLLETGRTHQIRVHMQSLGHSLIGDKRYPNKNPLNEFQKAIESTLDFHLLHAVSLGFQHPASKENICFEVQPPLQFLETLKSLA